MGGMPPAGGSQPSAGAIKTGRLLLNLGAKVGKRQKLKLQTKQFKNLNVLSCRSYHSMVEG